MPSERIQRQIDRLLDEADDASRNLDWELAKARATAALGFDQRGSTRYFERRTLNFVSSRICGILRESMESPG